MMQISCEKCSKKLGWLHHPITQKDVDEKNIHDENPKYTYYCPEKCRP